MGNEQIVLHVCYRSLKHDPSPDSVNDTAWRALGWGLLQQMLRLRPNPGVADRVTSAGMQSSDGLRRLGAATSASCYHPLH